MSPGCPGPGHCHRLPWRGRMRCMLPPPQWQGACAAPSPPNAGAVGEPGSGGAARGPRGAHGPRPLLPPVQQRALRADDAGARAARDPEHAPGERGAGHEGDGRGQGGGEVVRLGWARGGGARPGLGGQRWSVLVGAGRRLSGAGRMRGAGEAWALPPHPWVPIL